MRKAKALACALLALAAIGARAQTTVYGGANLPLAGGTVAGPLSVQAHSCLGLGCIVDGDSTGTYSAAIEAPPGVLIVQENSTTAASEFGAMVSLDWNPSDTAIYGAMSMGVNLYVNPDAQSNATTINNALVVAAVSDGSLGMTSLTALNAYAYPDNDGPVDSVYGTQSFGGGGAGASNYIVGTQSSATSGTGLAANLIGSQNVANVGGPFTYAAGVSGQVNSSIGGATVTGGDFGFFTNGGAYTQVNGTRSNVTIEDGASAAVTFGNYNVIYLNGTTSPVGSDIIIQNLGTHTLPEMIGQQISLYNSGTGGVSGDIDGVNADLNLQHGTAARFGAYSTSLGLSNDATLGWWFGFSFDGSDSGITTTVADSLPLIHAFDFNQPAAAAGVIGELCAVCIGDVTNGTTNYAIQTSAGLVDLRGAVKLEGITGHGAKAPVCVDTSGNVYEGQNTGTGVICA